MSYLTYALIIIFILAIPLYPAVMYADKRVSTKLEKTKKMNSELRKTLEQLEKKANGNNN